MPKITDTASLRYLNGPQTAIFQDPYKPKADQRDDERLRLERERLGLAKQQSQREGEQANTGSLPTGYRWADASHTKQEIIPGGPADDTAQGGLSEQAMVQALLDGRMAFPTGAALRNPYWQNLIAKVAATDPTFDQVDYNARNTTRKDFTSGRSAQNIRALNTALGHLEQLKGQIGGTASHGGLPGATLVNWAENGLYSSAGSAGVTNYDQTAGALASELTQVFRGSGGAEADIKRELNSLSPNSSLSQKTGAVQNIATLLKSRLDALGYQYQQGMGRSAQPFQLLNPHAKQAYDSLSILLPGGGGYGFPGSGSGGSGNGGNNGPSGSNAPAENQPGLSATDGHSRAFYTQRDQALADEAQATFVEAMRSGGTPQQVRAAVDAVAQKYGAQSFGPELDKAIASGSLGVQFTPHPTGHVETGLTGSIANAVGSDYGSFATGVGNALSVGQLGNIAKATGGSSAGTDLAMDLSRQNVVPYMLGEMAGSVAPTVGAARGLGVAAEMAGSPVARALLTNPATANAVYGSAYGAGTSDSPMEGALIGGALSTAGSLAGAKIGAGIARLRSPSVAEALSRGESDVMNAVNTTGRDKVIQGLTDAANLDVPAALVDVSPEVNSLTGAAIRRSPTVAGLARDTLIPRGRGQIDRFGQAVERDLGPVANIPQLSADLGKQGATEAGPLYTKAFEGGSVAPLEQQFQTAFGDSSAAVAQAKRALVDAQNRATQAAAGVSRAGDNVYSASAALRGDRGAADAIAEAEQNLAAANATHQGNLDRLRQAQADGSANAPGAVWSPRIQQFLDDPISKAGLARGVEVQRLEALAAGKQFDPTELAITHMDEAGNPVVASVPNMRTLDAVKRGFDEILNDYPRLPGGQLVLDQRGRAVDQVRKAFLGHLDSINPDYAAARSAYAGPMASRDALDQGRAFYGMTPDTVGVAVQGQTPEQIGQMQLGYRGKMMDAAEAYRLSANPFDGVLGTRAAEDRLKTLYGDTPSVAQLLTQRDLEGQLAGSTNRLIGNSFTAGNQIADSAFAADPLVEGALHAGTALATHGASLPMTAMRFAGPTLRDRVVFGMGQRAAAKADEIGPITLNTNPRDTIASILAMEQRLQDNGVARALAASAGAQRGSKVGASVAGALIPYETGN